MNGYMGFVGVSTGSSSIMKVFPRWAELLDLPTRELVGHDLPMDATPADYRALVTQIQDDPRHLGALVTTHKLALFAATHDLFSELDRFASLCGEVSSISKRDGALVGHAKDPITVGLALDEFLSPTHFRDSGSEAIILGAGGAGTALSWHLVERVDAPEIITVVDTSDARLAHLAEVHHRRGTQAGVIRYVNPAQLSVTELLATAPAGSLVVNATGLGKDRPGSPLSDDAVFPKDAVVWEFNYRGSLDFLHQARAQEEAQRLTVVDGWRYFIHGWTQVIGEVFGVTMTPPLVDELADAAEFARAQQ
ncbi:shikimate dehydrogenase [Salinibacterium sp. NK8237]|uniref:shikimate dehydrogenase family protein n=1 Tax=Salinibacterium sp. NK8237 TaxID=2792038 RepID=UPI0018CCAF71|nr:shikimate dehydrogenase [Salinibacterium sp. NK8237]MBH0130194.1 shikimate dehydrogenase [Salinibacterium sp. NK8237]